MKMKKGLLIGMGIGIIGLMLIAVSVRGEWVVDNTKSGPGGLVYTEAGRTKLVVDSEWGYDWNGSAWTKVDIDKDLNIYYQDGKITFAYRNNNLMCELSILKKDNKLESIKDLKSKADLSAHDVLKQKKSGGLKYSISLTGLSTNLKKDVDYLVLVCNESAGYDIKNFKKESQTAFTFGKMKLTFDDAAATHSINISEKDRMIYIGNVTGLDNIFIDPALIINSATQSLYGNLTYDYVEIKNSGVLNVAPYNCSSYGNTSCPTGFLRINATYNITVDSTSRINADNITGGGGSNVYRASGSCGNGAFQYGGSGGGGLGGTGGRGGNYSTAYYGGNGGGVFGNATDRFSYMGGTSCCGEGYSPWGGGIIELNSPLIIINGTISSNGGYRAWGDPTAGGGSGGTICLNCQSIGTTQNVYIYGTLRADGGNGFDGGAASCNGGGGGGGYVKIFYTTLINSTATVTVNKGLRGNYAPQYCGTNDAQNGTAGVIYYQFLNEVPVVNLVSPANASTVNNVTPTFTFNVTDAESSGPFPCNLYVNGILRGSNSSVIEGVNTNITSNASLSDALYSWYMSCSDGIATGTSATWYFTVSASGPLNIVWNSPAANNTNLASNWIYWNISTWPTQPKNSCILNANGTNYTMTISGNYCHYNLTGLGLNTSTCGRAYVNDTLGNANTSAYICANSFGYAHSQTYSANVIEGTPTALTINITANTGITDISAYLVYNGTVYSATESVLSTSNSYFTRNVTAPEITNTTTSANFFWAITFTTPTNIFYINTSMSSQTIHKIILTNCSAATESTTKALWFYIKEEGTGTPISNATFGGTFTVTNGYGLERDYSFSFNNANNYSICLYPAWASYYADAIIQYSGTGYSVRSYIITDNLLSNSTQTINLYLQSNATVSVVLINVQGLGGSFLEGIVVDIQRYYPGTGTYESVGSYLTDNNGQATAYLNLYDVWYRFTFLRDGNVIYSVDPMLVTSTTLYFTINEYDVGEWFDYFGDTAYSCDISNVTNTTTCSVIDTGGLMVSSRLQVKELLANYSWADVCDITSTSPSVTHVCDLGDLDSMFWYSLTATYEITTYPLESGTMDYRDRDFDYGDAGVFVALFIIIVVTFMTAFRPGIGLIGAGVSVALTFGYGLINLGGIGVAGWGSIVALFIAFGVAIIKMRQ